MQASTTVHTVTFVLAGGCTPMRGGDCGQAADHGLLDKGLRAVVRLGAWQSVSSGSRGLIQAWKVRSPCCHRVVRCPFSLSSCVWVAVVPVSRAHPGLVGSVPGSGHGRGVSFSFGVAVS